MRNAIIDIIIEAFGRMTDPKLLNNDSSNLMTFVNTAISSQAFTGLQAIAGSLIAFFFLIHLVQTTMKERSDPDAIFKDLALCCLYAAIVTNLGTLITDLAQVCINITNIIKDGIGSLGLAFGASKSLDVNTFKDGMKDKNIAVLLLDGVLYMLLGNIVAGIIQVIAKVALYTTYLSIMIRTILLPLGVAQLPDEGFRGNGARALKAYCAEFLNIGVISASIGMYGSLSLWAMDPTNMDTVFVTIVASGFACAGICMKANSLAKEIMGA